MASLSSNLSTDIIVINLSSLTPLSRLGQQTYYSGSVPLPLSVLWAINKHITQWEPPSSVVLVNEHAISENPSPSSLVSVSKHVTQQEPPSPPPHLCLVLVGKHITQWESLCRLGQ